MSSSLDPDVVLGIPGTDARSCGWIASQTAATGKPVFIGKAVIEAKMSDAQKPEKCSERVPIGTSARKT
jgi:hypothetical protein